MIKDETWINVPPGSLPGRAPGICTLLRLFKKFSVYTGHADKLSLTAVLTGSKHICIYINLAGNHLLSFQQCRLLSACRNTGRGQ